MNAEENDNLPAICPLTGFDFTLIERYFPRESNARFVGRVNLPPVDISWEVGNDSSIGSGAR